MKIQKKIEKNILIKNKSMEKTKLSILKPTMGQENNLFKVYWLMVLSDLQKGELNL